MLLGNTEFKVPVRKTAGKLRQPRSVLHRRRNGADCRNLLRKRDRRSAEHSGKIGGGLLRYAGIRIEGVDTVVYLRFFLRGRIALPLHCHRMDNDRAAEILRPAQRHFKRFLVVAVHRPDIVKAEIVKNAGRQKARFDPFLEPMQFLVGMRMLLHNAAVGPLKAEIPRACARAAKQPGNAADVLVNGHTVVVKNDHSGFAARAEIAQSFIAHAAGHGAVAHNGNNVIASVYERPGACHARRQRHRVGGMAGKERIGVALARLGKTGNTVELAQRIKGIAASGQNLVDVGLMSNIEQYPVLHRVIDAVKRNRKLNAAEI